MDDTKNKPAPVISLTNEGEIQLSLPFFWVVILLSLPYLGWEIYWFNKVGYPAFKWHTHLAVYYYACLYFYLFFTLLHRLFSFKKDLRLQVLLVTVFSTLALAEGALIATGTGDTYSEHIGHAYFSNYGSSKETYYRLHKPYEQYVIERPEFNYLRPCNSLGYSDVEWTMAKKKNEKRIACFGDSFTEGVGAPFDSCYVSQLRQMLQAEDSNITVMNAGISGDDPCVNFVNYRDKVAAFKPDILVQTLSSNDMNTDIATKGGLERFGPNETLHYKKGPWWEPIYALSYVSRLVFRALGYNELLLRVPFSTKVKEELNQKAIETFAAYAAEAKKQGAVLLVVLQPDQFAVYQKKFEYDLSPIVAYLKTLDHVKVCDLTPFYLNEFARNQDDIKTYYWPQDGHHNSKGYALMARSIQHSLDSLYLKN